MTTNTRSNDQHSQSEATPAFFEAQLPPGELEGILKRIEENLAARQVIREPSRKGMMATAFLPAMPSLSGLEAKLAQLQALKAPLFRPGESSGWSALARRVLNLPIRLFGHKQTQFNNELLGLLTEMTVLFHQTLTEQHETLVAMHLELENLTEQQQQLESKLLEVNNQQSESPPKSASGE